MDGWTGHSTRSIAHVTRSATCTIATYPCTTPTSGHRSSYASPPGSVRAACYFKVAPTGSLRSRVIPSEAPPPPPPEVQYVASLASSSSLSGQRPRSCDINTTHITRKHRRFWPLPACGSGSRRGGRCSHLEPIQRAERQTATRRRQGQSTASP